MEDGTDFPDPRSGSRLGGRHTGWRDLLQEPVTERAASSNAFLSVRFAQAPGEAFIAQAEVPIEPLLVPHGVSNALGAVGYASTIDEIAASRRAGAFVPRPSFI
jgi:hypothetical protein